MGLTVALILFAVGCIVWKILQRYVFQYWYARKIPTVQPVHPILGHAQCFMRKNLHEVFWSIVRLFNAVDRVAKIRIGPVPGILVNHPDLLQDLMNRSELYDKPFLYEYLRLGKGLITDPTGSSWRCNRRLLNTVFRTRALNEFLPIMDATVKNMVGSLEPRAKEEVEVDIFQHISQCTLEIVFSTTMGCNMKGREGEEDYVRSFEILTTCMGERLTNMDKYLEPIYKMTNTYRIEQANYEFCIAFGDRLIDERKLEMATDPEYWSHRDSNDGIQAKTLNFLDQILTIKKPDGSSFSDKEVSEHISTIVVAGNETSALTASFTCLYLALDPAIQSKVIEEIKQVFPSRSVEVAPETLKQLTYLEMVLKETLRLCPSIPFIGRNTAAPIELDGFNIPKDQVIFFSLYNLHRRPDIWGDDVERFDPERFRPELVKERHPYAYLPFSGGQRNCIGGRFAMNVLKIMLLRILQNFELSTNLKREDLRIRWTVSMKLVQPYAIRLKKRDLYAAE